MDFNEILYYGELLSVVSYKMGELLLEAGETCKNIFLTIRFDTKTPNRYGELRSAGLSKTLAF